ncbi:type I-E CRISPR-associated protein Cas7/Cse4/CasC [Salana multivorans]
MTTRTYLDVHVLQSVPPSCINRDDTGSPKSAVYGGARRSRVSSQAWKRATRKAFDDLLPEKDRGVRTKRVVEMVSAGIGRSQAGAGLPPEQVEELAVAVVTATGLKLAKARNSERQDTEFLVLVSAQQAAALAELAVAALDEASGAAGAVTALKTAESRKEAKRVLQHGNSIDLALFGRMVANDTDLNVDATCQVAHAISIHAAGTEFDYFTAVDDLKELSEDGGFGDGDAGAGMIGTIEFTSATLYRYATINVEALVEALGTRELAEEGIAVFLTAFVRSMPTGKQNTFANNTLPEAVVVSLREDQAVSYVGAFEEPITSSKGYAVAGAERLAEFAGEVADAYGVGPVQSWVVGVGAVGDALAGIGTRGSFAALPSEVAQVAVARVAEPV